VLYGSLSQLGGTYSLDTRLYDASDARSRATFFREGAGSEDLLAKMGGLAQEVKRSLTATVPVADTGPGQVSRAATDTSRAGSSGGSGAASRLGLRVGDNKKPIAITSDSLEALNKQNMVVFRGNVEARQADLRIFCDVMTVLYSSDGKGIVRIVADRNVRIIHEPAPMASGRRRSAPASGVLQRRGKIVLGRPW
jgi:hypothetical protein